MKKKDIIQKKNSKIIKIKTKIHLASQHLSIKGIILHQVHQAIKILKLHQVHQINLNNKVNQQQQQPQQQQTLIIIKVQQK